MTSIRAILGVIEGIRHLGMSDEEWAAECGALPLFSRLKAGCLGCAIPVLLGLAVTALTDMAVTVDGLRSRVLPEIH